MAEKLDSIARAEIREAMTGLSGKQAKAEAQRLAAHYEVSINAVYEASRAVRPARQSRSDKGKRAADLMEHPGLRFAAELVVSTHCTPEDALRTARLNGYEIPVSDGTFTRYMKEQQINRKANKTRTTPHRRFEAEKPGDLFQFDISAIKLRWVDVETRKIFKLGVEQGTLNHPVKNPGLVNLWRFVGVDDHSRRKFIRYYAVAKESSLEVVDFLLAWFREMGVPKKLYCDNAATIKSTRVRRAAEILNKAFAESGGFEITHHAPYNARATGKVERAHRATEETEKMIGVFEHLKGRTPSFEELQEFALTICTEYDKRPHSSTGVAPIIRWQSSLTTLRIPGDETLNAAFKARELERKLNGDLTVSIEGELIQLPGARKDGLSLVDYIGQMVTLLIPDQESWLVVITKDRNEFTVERQGFAPDAAGEFKSFSETQGEANRKALLASARERKHAIKSGEQEPMLVPRFDAEPETAPAVAPFPKPKIEMPREAVATLLPGAPEPARGGRWLNYYDAFDLLEAEGVEFESRWLKSLFAMCEQIEEAELRQTLAARQPQVEEKVLQFKRA